MAKIIVGLHAKPCSFRAVNYAARLLEEDSRAEVTLVHALPPLPAHFWDEGHILDEKEKHVRSRMIESWMIREQEAMEPIFEAATHELVRSGLNARQIQTRFITEGRDIADALLAEAKRTGATTIVIGKCSLHEGGHLLVGNVMFRLVQHASGLGICVAT